MPRITKLAPPERYRPPDEYWGELREQHWRLINRAKEYYDGWWRTTAAHSWTRLDEADHNATVDDRHLRVSWGAEDMYGRRKKQGVLRLSRLMLQASTPNDDVVHGVEKLFMYNYGLGTGGPRAFVYTSGFEIRNIRDPEKIRKVHSHIGKEMVRQVYEQGLLDPSTEEYDELLQELRIGASGEGCAD
jgi:hypothetical protein